MNADDDGLSSMGFRVDDLTPVEGLTSPRSPAQIGDWLRAGIPPSDRAFDRHLPQELRVLSLMHWTPLVAAVRAAEWLDELDIGTVVDIGSGPGKFCVAAALAGGSRFLGLERRPRLVEAARALARVFGCDDRVSFVAGEFGATPIPIAEAYYLYNPFEENLFAERARIDSEVELNEARYVKDCAKVIDFLAVAPHGTYLLTYNDFGAPVPSSYQCVRIDHSLPNVLRLWRKIEGGR